MYLVDGVSGVHCLRYDEHALVCWLTKGSVDVRYL